MTIWCSYCEEWSPLPLDAGQGEVPRACCASCQTVLLVEERYALCPSCGHYFPGSYSSCPLCDQSSTADPLTAVITERQTPGGTVSIGAQEQQTRDGAAYWQLFFDYLPPPASPTSTSANRAGDNGNSHAGGRTNGHYAGNGSNGNGNGQHAEEGEGGASATVDLAIADTVPLALFSDMDALNTNKEGDVTPALNSAGNYNEFDYELIDDPSRLAQVAELLAQETVVGIDTETTGLDPHTSELLLLQVSTTNKVYVIDCKRLVPLALKPLLENPNILKVAQNAKFEYEMLRQQAGITLAGMFDTMLAERICTSGISREISLKQIAHKYIGATLDKTVRESFYKLAAIGDAYLAPEQLHYAARDAFIMIPIWHLQTREIKKLKLEQVADLEFRCIAAVGDLELAGVQIDVERWRKIIDDVAVQRDRASTELGDMLAAATMQATMFGVSAINLNSNVQLIETFAKLGVNLPDTMESTLVKFDHPAVAKLLEYRGHEKTLSAFGENVLSLINPKTGRIHPDFNQHGADTGRFSCTRPNVQQIPSTSDFRKCFVAAPGYKLVTCDYSQAELRILAELSGDEGFVSAFKSGGDLHSLTASQMFGVPLEAVEKPMRSAAKSINFGLAYGMGPSGLAPRLGVTVDEAKDLIAKYFKAYPGVQRWLDKAARDAVRLGYSETTLGRKRFYNMPDENLKRVSEDDWRKQIAAIERQGKNSPIQGGNADMTKLALVKLRAALRGWDARTVNTVHDEIVVEVRADQAEEVTHIVEKAMVDAGEAILTSVPVVADASLADYWSK